MRKARFDSSETNEMFGTIFAAGCLSVFLFALAIALPVGLILLLLRIFGLI